MTDTIRTSNAMPREVREALEHVIDHHWDDAHQEFMCQAASDRSGHVFLSMQTVQRWLFETRQPGPDDPWPRDSSDSIATPSPSRSIPAEVACRLREGTFGGRYGGCPTCGFSEGPFNVRKANWLICSRHRVRWCVGHNLFDHLEGEWRAAAFIDSWLSKFQEIPASQTLSPDNED